MRRLFALALGILFGGTLMFMAFQFHVVRTKDSVLLVKKQETGLRDFYVDIRKWKFREWKEHMLLADAMVAAGHKDLVVTSAEEGLFQDLFSRMGKSLFETKPPAKPAAPTAMKKGRHE